jgi:hypothetical protein
MHCGKQKQKFTWRRWLSNGEKDFIQNNKIKNKKIVEIQLTKKNYTFQWDWVLEFNLNNEVKY